MRVMHAPKHGPISSASPCMGSRHAALHGLHGAACGLHMQPHAAKLGLRALQQRSHAAPMQQAEQLGTSSHGQVGSVQPKWSTGTASTALLTRIRQSASLAELEQLMAGGGPGGAPCGNESSNRSASGIAAGASPRGEHVAAACKRLVLLRRQNGGVGGGSSSSSSAKHHRQPAQGVADEAHIPYQLMALAQQLAPSLNSGQVATILWAAAELQLQPSASCLTALQVGVRGFAPGMCTR